jgi:hypothetical protein
MSELMQQHNQKQRQILQHVPGDRGITSFSNLDFVRGHHEPGPMEKYIDSGETKKVD